MSDKLLDVLQTQQHAKVPIDEWQRIQHVKEPLREFVQGINKEADEFTELRRKNDALVEENKRLRRLNSEYYAVMRHSLKKLFKKLEDLNDENLKHL